MKWFIIVLLALTGCTSPPSLVSAWNQFERHHPDVVVLRVSKSEFAGSEVGRGYAEFAFKYRENSGKELEEIWRYEQGEHAWGRRKVTTPK